MLKIRLKPTGRKHDPNFRLVVVESTRGVSSNSYVESIGHYNPRTKAREIDAERAKHWLSQGAQPTGTAYNMLVDAKVIEGEKKNVLPHKSPVVTEAEEESKEAAATEEAAGEENEAAESSVEEEPAAEAEEAAESKDEPEEEKPAESDSDSKESEDANSESAPEETEKKEA